MTTFTDDDKKLIKEIRSESAAWTCETILSAGLMKLSSITGSRSAKFAEWFHN